MGIGGYHLYAAGAGRVLCHGSCILTFLLLPYNVLGGLASLGLVCVLDPCSLEYSCTVRLIVFGQHDFRTIQPLFMRVIFSSSQFVHFWLSGCASDRCFLYLWIIQAGVVAKSGRDTVVLRLPPGEYYQRFGTALARVAAL